MFGAKVQMTSDTFS